MDLKVQAKVVEHLYHIIMQTPFDQKVAFKVEKKPYITPAIKQRLPRKSPESVGVSRRHLEDFLQEIKDTRDLNIHQLMVLKDEAVILEAAFAPYRMDLWHVTHSLCKTVTAMAIGILVGDGLISLDDKLTKIFESSMPPLSKFKLGKITVRHLLTMSTGAMVNESLICAEEDWLKAYFDTGLHFEPGSKFQYNSINSYVLSSMVQQITGKTMFAFLQERLFSKMGIDNIQWESCPMGRTKGGWGMYILPEDMAKLGLLMQQEGSWKGKSLIPKDYIVQMTSKQIDSSPEEGMYGYGFQTWMGKLEGSFLFNGMLGQNIHVVPSLRLVIVVTGGNDKLFGNCAINHLIYKYFTDAPIPPADAAEPGEKVSSASMRPKNLKSEFGWWRDGTGIFRMKQPKPEKQILALAGKAYVFPKPNVRLQPLFAQFINNSYAKCVERMAFSLEEDRFCLRIKQGEEENRIVIGFKAPEYSQININSEPYLVAAHGCFTSDEDSVPVFKITIPFVEHSNGRIIKLFFLPENKVRVEWKEFPGSSILADGANNFLATMNPTILGQLKSHIDIDMILAMADGIMEPVSMGVLEEANLDS